MGIDCICGVSLNLKDRLAGIDANLDDLQAGAEACTRAAEALHNDAVKFDQILKRIKDAPFIASLLKRLGDLEVFARDQEGTLQELREHFDRLQEGLPAEVFGAKPSRLATAADRRRR
jgi:hypothetical protein